MKHYGIPEEILAQVRIMYNGMNHLSVFLDPFKVSTGGSQGCQLLSFLFFQAVDSIMKHTQLVKGMAFNGLL